MNAHQNTLQPNNSLVRGMDKPSPSHGHVGCHSHRDSQNSQFSWIVLAEGIFGSLFILAAPFVGDYFHDYGGSRFVAVILSIFHFLFHIGGGILLFKTGMDLGKLQRETD